MGDDPKQIPLNEVRSEDRALSRIQNVRQFMESAWSVAPRPESKRIFRGQGDEWDLLPKLFRAKLDPGTHWTLERNLELAFRERCLYLLPSVPTDVFGLFSVGQHYGLPTRLLDWSTNPLMALFFAVEERSAPAPIVWLYDASSDQIKHGRDLQGLDSLTNLQAFLEQHAAVPVSLLEPLRHSHRVTAQAGIHTVHWQSSVPMNRDPEAASCLVPIRIDPKKTSDIRHELRAMGIHSATVYGDLSSVCREIENDLNLPLRMRREVRPRLSEPIQLTMTEHVLVQAALNCAIQSQGPLSMRIPDIQNPDADLQRILDNPFDQEFVRQRLKTLMNRLFRELDPGFQVKHLGTCDELGCEAAAQYKCVYVGGRAEKYCKTHAESR